MVGFVHFSNSFIPSEKYYKLQAVESIFVTFAKITKRLPITVHLNTWVGFPRTGEWSKI